MHLSASGLPDLGPSCLSEHFVITALGRLLLWSATMVKHIVKRLRWSLYQTAVSYFCHVSCWCNDVRILILVNMDTVTGVIASLNCIVSVVQVVWFCDVCDVIFQPDSFPVHSPGFPVFHIAKPGFSPKWSCPSTWIKPSINAKAVYFFILLPRDE